MAKSGKGLTFSTILLSVGIVVQVATIGIVYMFLKDAKDAQLFQSIQEAQQSAEWKVPFEELPEKEKSTLKQFVLNAEQTTRSYWHSEDRQFRFTIQSDGLKELMFNRVLVVKEAKLGKHLVLTVYYNPLLQKKPQPEDLVPIYQLVRYEKPELAKLYEEQERQKEKKSSKEEKDGSETSKEDKKETSDVLKIKKEDILYPFEEERILINEEDHIVYEQIRWSDLNNLLNQELLMKYLDESSFKGDYGWEEGIFYWEVEKEEVETESEIESEETSEGATAEETSETK